MKNYSVLSKILHKAYLKNYFISRASLELEFDLHKKKILQKEIEKVVFISGLARSGTTILLRKVFSSNEFASLQYNNMPFLFLPNLWSPKSKIKSYERAHGDSIKINESSPEEFDEYFWKVHLDDNYIKKNHLNIHEIDNVFLDNYIKYIKLVCLSKSQKNYITKNNNNILRISSLYKIPNSYFFFLIRNPLDHASSLLKLHKKFIKEQKKDIFSLDYFNFLGHHEFGIGHKPFNLIYSIFDQLKDFDINSIEYWLIIWKQYYCYLLKIYNENFIIILFEDFIMAEDQIVDFINQLLKIKIAESKDKKFIPPSYKNHSSNILDECNQIYSLFLEKRKYV